MGFFGVLDLWYARDLLDQFAISGTWVSGSGAIQQIGSTLEWEGILYNVFIYNQPAAVDSQEFVIRLVLNGEIIGPSDFDFAGSVASLGLDNHTKPISISSVVDGICHKNYEFPAGVKINEVEIYAWDTTGVVANNVTFKLFGYGDKFA